MSLKGTIDYTIEKELGSGQFGVTYLAKGSDGNRYAIKKFNKEGDKELEIEQGALMLISSICDRYSACFVESIQNNNNTYMVIDYIEGVDLAEIIYGPRKGSIDRDPSKKLMKLEERKGINIISNLVAGLKMMHEFGLIHQDIKPENLMYTDNGIKFVDFGLACISSKAEDIGYPVFGTSINYPCGSMGSIPTASPELFLWDNRDIRYYKFKPVGDRGIFPLSYLLAHDVWSLGCVIMAWYTLQDIQNEMFATYALSLANNAIYPKIFSKLEAENTERYNIIVSLFDRDPVSRIDNFNILANGIIPVIEPNWDNKNVTLRVREDLREWRCASKKISDLDFGEDCDHKIPEIQILDIDESNYVY